MPLRIGSQIQKGTKGKEQIYERIIPYMIRDGDKRQLSSATMEHAAYIMLHQPVKPLYKGNRPATGGLPSSNPALLY
ncbi:hypothetical protein M422DRAFT_277369 [Sphaerobolus stellatus SS14]|uniref:Uncharacterized protein n=1 Tax=Sphaerobolus stellatus (strain SS14) TaxID=990650 RepID=A0A0C9TK78_SPHS4|nr:hypothetical protein M422DRAFT_277369 [Sphaerobolus stellatus SS14]